jgi:hypothetical protein
MAYSDFTLEAVKQQFGLQTNEQGDYFAGVSPIPISDTLRWHLDRYQPLALAIGTEKSRSELLIMPILLDAYEQSQRAFSLFSGVDFNVDQDAGLRGYCDYILSLSPEQLAIEAPVVTVVEAKNENINRGIAQCLAEMVAAQRFNRARDRSIPTIYGVVTTGANWKFLRLIEAIAYIDQTEYYLVEVERIVAILLAMIREATA